MKSKPSVWRCFRISGNGLRRMPAEVYTREGPIRRRLLQVAYGSNLAAARAAASLICRRWGVRLPLVDVRTERLPVDPEGDQRALLNALAGDVGNGRR